MSDNKLSNNNQSDNNLGRASLRKSEIRFLNPMTMISDFVFLYHTDQSKTLRSRCVKGTKESTLEVDSSVPLTHHDPKDLRLICLIKKRLIHFRILSDLKIESWIFLKKRTLSNNGVNCNFYD